MVFNTWEEVFNELKKEDFFLSLLKFINKAYEEKVVFPPREDLFNAFLFTPLKDVKVVILGQDPYVHKGEAMGLAFSVRDGVKLPPSLKNIYHEIIDEYNLNINLPRSGDLTYLAKQGVLLLNPILTVEEGVSLSHKCKEYDLLFKYLMKVLNDQDHPIVFMLWGTKARVYKKLLTNPKHLIIETNHPSPLSANRGGWFKSNCFLNCNKFLKENNIKEIAWINEENIIM